jgi:ATP-dependent helicase/nuclease subunit B
MADALLELSRDELFARLALGRAGGTTVVTPNRRLAQTLAAAFDRRQQASGLAVWETADVLPYAAFVERLYEDALHSELAPGLPLLLGPDQEQSLWEDVLRRSNAGDALLAVPETAALAREAWTLAHAWDFADGLPGALAGEDATAFAAWAEEYRARTGRERFTDRARLAAVVADVLDEARVRKPALIVAYGFDAMTPQQRTLLEALAARGVAFARSGPARRAAQARRVACVDARAEFQLAARWARARLEANPDARIALVVPALHRHKRSLRRALSEVMDPGRAGGVLPFNLSLGDSLVGFPLVAHALAALELAGREAAFEQASRVIRSPFFTLAETGAQAGAGLDAWLRRCAEPTVTLDRLAGLLADAGALGAKLRAYASFRRERLHDAQSPADWARAFSEALAGLGFPGERGLDSDEYQTLQKWHEVLARLATLERVVPRMGFAAALARIRRMAGETLFQPETPDVPIQVLGVLEAAGMTFDHLWVSGLSDEAWPAPPHPNPFVPLRLQRAAGVPNATPASALEFAERLTAGWLAGAGEVVLSHPLREGDHDLAPSPFVARIPASELTLPDYGSWCARVHGSAALERIPDATAPALGHDRAIRGGASLLKDQSACPFRAFAVRRLAARGVDVPHAGLDAMERGTLVHRVLEAVWRRLGTKRALDALAAPELDALLTRAADEAIAQARTKRPTTLRGRFATIERDRLVGLAGDWLAVERGRDDFTVLPVEDRRVAMVGPLALTVRLDRVDEAATGERIVIDYKTSRPGLPSILRPRLDEPQLPLYATAAEPGAAAAAFAQVRAGEMRFVGLARAEGLLPGVATPAEAERQSGAQPDWDAQVAFWRRELERLAVEFAAGRADVSPKRGSLTCRECAVQPFCRIHERREAVGDED